MMSEEVKVVDGVVLCKAGLPLGQKCLAEGFRRITAADLRARFGADAVEDKSIEDAKRAIIARHPGKQKQWRFQVGYNVVRGHGRWWLYDEEPTMRVRVLFESLDSYVSDTIPERCLLSVARAKRIGVTNFQVAYPATEKMRLSDPVIVGLIPTGDVREFEMVEIDMWE